MKGRFCLVIEDTTLRYELVIDRQVSIIKGKSGTGKFTLVDMVRNLLTLGKFSGIHCIMKDSIDYIYNIRDPYSQIKSSHNKIFLLMRVRLLF